MSDIVITEKPDYVSYEVIRDIIRAAHRENIEKGIIMKTTTLSAEELEARVGKDGVCLTAMDGDKAVGTTSYRPGTVNRWYHRGSCLDWMLFGILPEYQGRHIASMLIQIVEEASDRLGFDIICFDTAAENKHMIQLCLKKGFFLVNYFSPKSAHYSVEMAKWQGKCPFPKWYIKLRYQLKKLYIRARFKPGKKKRFGI